MIAGGNQSVKSDTFILQGWWLTGTYICATSLILDAPLRYLCTLAHAAPAMYLRDVFAGIVMLRAFWHWILGGKLPQAVPIVCVLLMHMFWGMIMLPNVVQPIVGFKIYLTFILGACAYESIVRNEDGFARWIYFCYGITAVGVALNWALPMPWTGSTYDSVLGTVSVNREWTMAGINRVGGFCRASYEASTALCITGAAFLFSRRVNILGKLFVFILTTILIIATTSKGSIFAWLAMWIACFFMASPSVRDKAFRVIYILPALTLLPPLLVFLYEYHSEINGPLGWLLSSFSERINQMWPEALEITKYHGNSVFGRGLGSIGFAQQFGESNLFNAADNAMLYLYVSMGIPAIIYVYFIIRQTHKRIRLMSHFQACLCMMLLTHWLVYGLTGNNIESAFVQFFSGVVVAAALRSTAEPTKERRSA